MELELLVEHFGCLLELKQFPLVEEVLLADSILVKFRNRFVYLDQSHWITCNLEPSIQHSLCPSLVIGVKHLAQLPNSRKFYVVTHDCGLQPVKVELTIAAQDLLQGLFEVPGGA